jgi:hypothetical protein
MAESLSSGDLQAGAFLDRLIELKVFGRKPVGEVPRYSTDDAAAERILAQLNRSPLRWMAIQDGDTWICSWRHPGPGDGDTTATRYMKLVSASAETRPLAICRSALRLVASREKPDRK